MLKQSLIYLVLSSLVVIFAKYAHLLIVYIDLVYAYINLKLAPIFSTTPLGSLVRNVCLLVLLPIIITAVPALIYRLIKGHTMPYFIEITWLLWLILACSKLLIH